jgi:hypothetical protein
VEMIVEYYPRQNITGQSSAASASGIEVLFDVSPGGTGYERFISRLQALHPSRALTLAIVDVSSSVQSGLPRVRADLKVARSKIAFGDNVLVFSSGLPPRRPPALARHVGGVGSHVAKLRLLLMISSRDCARAVTRTFTVRKVLVAVLAVVGAAFGERQARRHVLNVLERQKSAALTDDEAMALGPEAQRWARRQVRRSHAKAM